MLLVPAKYGANLNARAAVVEQMLAKIRDIPQVSAAPSIHFLPLNGIGSGSGVYRADRPAPQPGSMLGAGFSVISDGYFHAMGIPLIAGREFDSRDRPSSTLVAVISRSAARMLYQDENPIGKQLMVSWNGPPQATSPPIRALKECKHRPNLSSSSPTRNAPMCFAGSSSAPPAIQSPWLPLCGKRYVVWTQNKA